MAKENRPKKRLPRYRRAQNFRLASLRRREVEILWALHRFFYLSTDQVIRLIYRPTTASYAREHLKRLYHGGYVECKFQLKFRQYLQQS